MGGNFFLLGLFAAIGAGAVSFRRVGSGIFFSWDSATYLANAKEYFDSGNVTGMVASYSQSLGNMAYAINFNLIPEARLAYVNGQISPVLMMLIATGLFYASTFATARVILGFGARTAVVSGLAMVALTMPYTSPPIYSEIFWWHSPYAIAQVYQFSALLLTYHLLGQSRTVVNIGLLAILVAEIVWISISNAKGSVIIIFGASLLAVAITTSSVSRRVFIWRLIGAIAVLATLLMPGIFNFVRGLYSYTGNILVFTDLGISSAPTAVSLLRAAFPTFDPLQLWGGLKVWMSYQIGYPLLALSITGIVAEIRRPHSSAARHFAVAMVAISPVLLTFGYGMAIGSMMYPLLVIFAIRGASAVVQCCWRLTSKWLLLRFRDTGRRELEVALERPVYFVVFVLLAVGALTFAARYRQHPHGGWREPPSKPALIEYLASRVRFSNGDTFKGRYVDISISQPLEAGIFPPGTSLSAGLMKTAYDHVASFGNDMTIQGPRYFDVPVTVEVNRMSTPASVLFHNILLVRQGDIERIDMRTITRFDSRLFAMLGLRFVLSHVPIQDSRAIAVDVPGLPKGVHLYEIKDVNLGQYSPVRAIQAHDWRFALSTLESPDFDPSQVALVHSDWIHDAGMRHTARATIERTNAGYRVRAKSDGSSLLVLPFEFSRCLRVSGAGRDVRIGRVNFLLTGLSFDKEVDAELQFRFGPFDNSDCRIRDLEDLREMSLNPASVAEFKKRYPGRLLFVGGF